MRPTASRSKAPSMKSRRWPRRARSISAWSCWPASRGTSTSSNSPPNGGVGGPTVGALHRRPHGRYLGLAFMEGYTSLIAQIAEISVTGGELKVHKITCVVDCGQMVNPRIVESQIESGIVFGLTAALWGDITISAGRVQRDQFQYLSVAARQRDARARRDPHPERRCSRRDRRIGGRARGAGDLQRHIQRDGRAAPIAADHLPQAQSHLDRQALVGHTRHRARRAASIAAMSIFFMVIIASNARLAAAGSGSEMASMRTRGVICQDTPHLSLHQPHWLS